MFNDEDEDMGWMMDMGSSFRECYQCLSASELASPMLRQSVEYGGKVILPASALETLSRLDVSYPLMFEIENDADSRKTTHCGVLEFSAAEGTIYLPLWVMDTIGVKSNDFINVTNVSLPLGQFVRLQPQSSDFLDVSDPRAVLEHNLRNFSSLTRNDMIQINYNDKIYKMQVMEVRPPSGRHAISIVETDLQVDFDPPVGYVEPDYKAAANKQQSEKSIVGSISKTSLSSTPVTSSFKAFSGFGNRLNTDIAFSTGQVEDASPKAIKLPPGVMFFSSKKTASPVPPSFSSDKSDKTVPFSGQGNKLK